MFMRGGFGKGRDPPFFYAGVCHPNADFYSTKRSKHETEKKRQHSSRVMEIEYGTFTPLVLTTAGGMACRRYHC